MAFVDLKRSFVQIKKETEPSEAIEVGATFGHRYGGWLDWPKLLDHQRVVLLAEAASGKSEEFKHAASGLRAKGSTSFYATIEQLADRHFLDDPAERAMFEAWKSGDGPAWFFLDSVDEARLNQKKFDHALSALAANLGKGMSRARVLVSCRVSDWKNTSDRATILDVLPVGTEPPPPLPPSDLDKALLDPIFEREEKPKLDLDNLDDADDEATPELLVVQLVPLTEEQRRKLAIAFGVSDAQADEFLKAIEQNGLDVLAERPGDLRELALYWSENRGFGTLAKMTETAVAAKLKEEDSYRPDNAHLSVQKARLGAERLAGALTLAKTFTLLAPGSEVDLTLAEGALDPTAVLDLTIAESNTLMRRGIFAPSTYGRVRFHHRSTQEYLAACWLDRLLREGCEPSEVSDLLFVEAHGVRTVAPSLRATAAWLSLRRPDFREEILAREPLLLMTHGDPGSLPIETKSDLLLRLAKRHAGGDVADDSIDRRSLWMFASPALADAVRQAWDLNTRDDFRTDLIRLVREGAITACVDLAAGMASDTKARDFSRTVAVEALVACRADTQIRRLVANVMRSKASPSPRLASSFAKALFPGYLSVKQLLDLMAKCATEDEHTFEGFVYTIDELWAKCPSPDRDAFIAGLAGLCCSRPFVDSYRRVSAKYKQLAKHLGGIARSAMLALGDGTPSPALLRLLSAIERAERDPHTTDKPTLNELVRGNKAAQRLLFWHDVRETREHRETKEEKVVEIWHIYFDGSRLWDLSDRDLDWLYEDLGSLPEEDDRRVALSAIHEILGKSLKSKKSRLAKKIGRNRALKADLKRYLAPVKRHPALVRRKREREAHKQEREAKRKIDKKSWLDFRAELLAEPRRLSDAATVTVSPTFNWLLNLSTWLGHKTEKSRTDAPPHWRLLEPVFGKDVADNYRDGMKALWRAFEPVRPTTNEHGQRSVKWLTVLSFAGVGVEAVSEPGFASKLTKAEIRRAALHGCLAEQGYPEWIEALIPADPPIVVPIVVAEFEAEWKAPADAGGYYLYRFSKESSSLHPDLQRELYRIISASEPATIHKLDYGLGILRRVSTTTRQRVEMRKLALSRFNAHANADAAKPGWAARYLALLFFLDPQEAFRVLASWLKREVAAKRGKLAETALALLFGRHDGLALEALSQASVATLESLLHLAFQMVRPSQDEEHDGVYEPSTRDDAENARNSILRTLIETTGGEAFAAMMRLSELPDMKDHRVRFRELARRMAERDSDPPAWPASDVLAFEQTHMLPVRTGAQLYRVAKKVLEEIAWEFDHEDSSSRPVLETAEDEDAVQHYLADQLRLRSKNRFHRIREGEVAEGNKPDIILAATQGTGQVAIEAKHGGKKWSTATLEDALRSQLAEDYLRPLQRRHGLLVVTNHKRRGWKHPRTRKPLSFSEIIAYLNDVARTITRNTVGDISVAVVGIDALPRARRRSKARAAKRRTKAIGRNRRR